MCGNELPQDECTSHGVDERRRVEQPENRVTESRNRRRPQHPKVLEMHVNEQSGQKGQAELIENRIEEAGGFRRRAVLNSRVDFEQPARVDREQRKNQKEEQAFEKPRAAMTENQRDQKQVDESPRRVGDQS